MCTLCEASFAIVSLLLVSLLLLSLMLVLGFFSVHVCCIQPAPITRKRTAESVVMYSFICLSNQKLKVGSVHMAVLYSTRYCWYCCGTLAAAAAAAAAIFVTIC
jgi:hypothetical protein